MSITPRTKASGIQMCGALIQRRHCHNASSASGQVGQRNQGRSRIGRNTASRSGTPKNEAFQIVHASIQSGFNRIEGNHHANPSASANSSDQSIQRRDGQSALPGRNASGTASRIGSVPGQARVRNAQARATPRVIDPCSGLSSIRASE